jgi:hypothetical protein
MTKFSPRAADEVADKNSDSARRRTKPRVEGAPLSPRAIDRIYTDKDYPLGKTAKTHPHQKNQDPEDQHDNSKRGRYDNDVPEGSWLRGHGSVNGALYPKFDHGKLDPASKPPRPATGNRASGQDIPASPFSAAHRTYSED